MSFGFSVGDFLAVIERANHIRTRFVGAPAQLKALSDEVRNLAIVVTDIKIDLSNTSLSSQQGEELREIAASCDTVLCGIEKTIERYSAINAPHSFKRVWKRLRWEPDDARDLRNRLCSNISLLNAINGRITRDGVLELLQHKNSEEEEKCLEWLSLPDYAIQQSDLVGRRQPGTGVWFLETPEFRTWVQSSQQTLFCPGIPGAGKTMLASVVIDELEDRFGNDGDVGVAYLFCSFERNDDQMQKPENLLASILRQLAQGLSSLPGSIMSLFHKHRTKGTRPSFNEAVNALKSVASVLPRVFIVVDALDECGIATITRILDVLYDLQKSNNLSILATSRFIPEIMVLFESKSTLEIRATKPDVMTYLNANIHRLPAFVSRNPELQEKITNDIANAVNGMFLLAQLYLDSLSGKRSERAMKRELEELVTGSKTYDTAYDKAMQRVENQAPGRRTLALEVLSWLTCAKRPLTTLELLHALAVELDEPQFHEDNLPDLDDILSVCAGLVTATADLTGNSVRLVHYTTKEYFDRKWAYWFSDAHQSLGTICLTYLSFNVFQSGKCYSDTEFKARLDQYPLYSYAAENWGHHARIQPVGEKALKVFFGDKGKINACVQAIFARNNFSSYGDYSNLEVLDWTGLHLAAYFGLHCVTQTMIQNCDESDMRDWMGRTPFTWAVYGGYNKVVELFLDYGVDAQVIDLEGRTPISLAASRGWLDTVKLLLDHSVDPASRDIDNQTPLSWAAYRGHTEVVKLLIARGANADSIDDYGKTPLSWAAADGWVELVHILIDQDVDVNSRDGLGRTPISYAAENGHLSVIRVLIDKGARLDIEDADGNTPAVWATHYGNQAALNLLTLNAIDLRPSLAGSEYNELSFDLALQNADPSSIPAFPTFRLHTPVLNGPSAHNEATDQSRLECPLCPKVF
ncbi:hypothetical protein CBS147321_10870 [Aspergillus niger]|nr:hypothetical protein CBS12448_10673 [Aspergillus niger]KAI2929223.1 hypothetical protein CBS147321_10870 [Aspergillus niger]KAI2943867.1 hypothetical protein CBS147322_8243 [Aspergillus niger]KAI3002706.1 hypothetical protein CBS147482_6592 [Aspergillus niger]KAI3044443.1 hypothetical protein CBS147352_8218 [Aspergillus niger]